MLAGALFTIGNVLCGIGTYRLLSKILKNRKILRDYDIWGSGITGAACLLFDWGFYDMRNYISFGFGLFTSLFWVAVTGFSILKVMRE